MWESLKWIALSYLRLFFSHSTSVSVCLSVSVLFFLNVHSFVCVKVFDVCICVCMMFALLWINRNIENTFVSKMHGFFRFNKEIPSYDWKVRLRDMEDKTHKKCNSFKRKLFEILKITLACLFVFFVVSLLLYSFIAFDWTEKSIELRQICNSISDG